MATSSSKKATSGKAAAPKPKTKAKAKPAPKGQPKPKPASGAADRPDKSVEEFRDALERSVTLSRERIQEVVDDAVKRGRMTRDDANELVTKLVNRGRKQTEELLAELEGALEAMRKEVGGRAKKARKEVERRTKTARKQAEKQVTKARKTAIGAADEPLAQADRLRAKTALPGFPITAYDELTAAQVKRRVGDLSKADTRKVRSYEKRNKARTGVLAAMDARLAA